MTCSLASFAHLRLLYFRHSINIFLHRHQQEKSLLDREEEQLADRLERKLTNQQSSGAESTTNITGSSVPNVSNETEQVGELYDPQER